MASPPLWLGKLNSLTDTFDVEIISDLDQRIPSSFGNKSWAIMTYLRPGLSASEVPNQNASLFASRYWSKDIAPRENWYTRGHGQIPHAVSQVLRLECLHMQDSFNRIGRVQQSSVSSHVHQELQAGFGNHDNFCGWFQHTLLAKLAHEVERLSPFELSESVGVSNFIVIILETLTLFLKMHL